MLNFNLLSMVSQKLSLLNHNKTIQITTLNSDTFNHITITKFYCDRLRQENLIAKNCYTNDYLWAGLIYFSIYYGSDIFDFSILSDTLKYLIIDESNLIKDENLADFALVRLELYNCQHITNLNSMGKTLKNLSIRGNTKVNQNGIKELRLVKLDLYFNFEITNLNHMRNTIKILYIEHCKINKKGIDKLKLLINKPL